MKLLSNEPLQHYSISISSKLSSLAMYTSVPSYGVAMYAHETVSISPGCMHGLWIIIL